MSTTTSRPFRLDALPDQSGRSIVVTGANAGLGLLAAESLARAGARVVLACRNQETGRRALDQVGAVAAPDAEPLLVRLDLSDLASVEEAAATIDAAVDSVDVLINNAGIMAVPMGRTADGFEMQIGTNHLGHFALTGRLLPALLRAPSPRVVTLSSIAHRQGAVDIDDLNYERRRYDRMNAYGQSKLANLLFSAELARRAERAGQDLISVAAHPGVAATSLFDSMVPPIPGARTLTGVGLRIVGNPLHHAAASQVYAATMPDVRNDDYWGPRAMFGVRGPVERCPRAGRAKSEGIAAALWERSAELTGQTYDELAHQGAQRD